MTLTDLREPIGPPGPVWLDGGGLLHVGSAWIALPDVEWRLVAALMAHQDEVVSRHDLIRAAWPVKDVKEGTLRVSMQRVRHRLAPLGLTVTTVRGRGFVMSTRGPSAR